MIVLSIIRDDILDTVEVFSCYWDAKDFTKEYLKAACLPNSAFDERMAPNMNGRVFVDLPALFVAAVERQPVDTKTSIPVLAYKAYSKVLTFDSFKNQTFNYGPPVLDANFTYDLPMGWDKAGKPIRYSQWINDKYNLKWPIYLTDAEAKALVLARAKQNPSFSVFSIGWQRTFNQADTLKYLKLDGIEALEIIKLEVESLQNYVENTWGSEESADYSEDESSWI